MVEENGIDNDVRSLLNRYIDSVEHLEILLLLLQNSDRSWTSTQVTQKLRNGLESAQSKLEYLKTNGFLVVDATDALSYRYTPKTPDLDASVKKLAKTYSERRVSILTLIFTKPLDKIQVFADAFKLRGK